MSSHRPLHQIRFHALPLAGEHLVRRNPVVYAPSDSVLAQRARQSVRRPGTEGIVVGDTRSNLRYARNKARLVADLLGIQPLIQEAAARAAILDAPSTRSDLRVVHIACHGYFDPDNAMVSGIVTARDDASPGGLAVLRAQDSLNRTLNVNLITFSACESGMSVRRAGDELMGCSRSCWWQAPPACSSACGRWMNLSTSILMEALYAACLRDGLSKAHALQRAQCHVMDLSADALRHIYHARTDYLPERDLVPVSQPVRPPAPAGPLASPFHLASFNLIGDWR